MTKRAAGPERLWEPRPGNDFSGRRKGHAKKIRHVLSAPEDRLRIAVVLGLFVLELIFWHARRSVSDEVYRTSLPTATPLRAHGHRRRRKPWKVLKNRFTPFGNDFFVHPNEVIPRDRSTGGQLKF